MNRSRITLLVLLYRAERSVPALVSHLIANVGDRRDLSVRFVDDASPDQTWARLQEFRFPDSRFSCDRNPTNLGLAGSLNRALDRVDTEFVLTVHSDVLIRSPDYVDQLVHVADSDPKIAAVTGQPRAPEFSSEAGSGFAAYANAVWNLMDFESIPGAPEFEEVGFAEGRCDLFRTQALREVGGWPTVLRTAGEDQILAARLRARGYRLVKANHAEYELGVSSAQDRFLPLLKHIFLLAKVAPVLLALQRGTVQGVLGARAGRNRQLRTLLRLAQLGSGMLWILAAMSVLAHRPYWFVLAVIVAFALKAPFLHAGMRGLGAGVAFRFGVWLLQPLADLAYTLGFVRGIFLLPKALRKARTKGTLRGT